jgi:hypothetical protein
MYFRYNKRIIKFIEQVCYGFGFGMGIGIFKIIPF